MGDFRMPSLGADMTEGTLLEWLVKPGDVVRRGDILAVVDTAKSAIDVEVFEDGRVEELLVTPGTTVNVGVPLARLVSLTEHPAAEPTAPAPAPSAAPSGLPAAPTVTPVLRHLAHELGVDLARLTGTGPDGAVTREDVRAAAAPVPEPTASAPATVPQPPGTARVKASPYARRRAAELGVDLATVRGTGARGTLTVADVEAAAASRPATAATPTPYEGQGTRQGPGRDTDAAERAAAMRVAIGALMARSKREIPHYYLQATLDLEPAMTLVERLNTGRSVGERLVPAALLLKAAAVAARAVPEVNGFYVDGEFRPQEHVHLGVAVSLRTGGLVAPAIHDADQLSVEELMTALKDLVGRARSGRLRASEMSDPTLTVTNLGEQGVEAVHGVIYPPQVALVGFGRVVERPWAIDRMLTVRRVLTATLAADHRVTDGHRGGRYLAAIEAALQKPEGL